MSRTVRDSSLRTSASEHPYTAVFLLPKGIVPTQPGNIRAAPNGANKCVRIFFVQLLFLLMSALTCIFSFEPCGLFHRRNHFSARFASLTVKENRKVTFPNLPYIFVFGLCIEYNNFCACGRARVCCENLHSTLSMALRTLSTAVLAAVFVAAVLPTSSGGHMR